MAAGTAAGIVPIRSITRRSRNDVFQYIAEDSEEPGPIFNNLLATLQGIQRGKIADPYGWCQIVQEHNAAKYAAPNGKDVLNDNDVDELP